MLLDRLHRPGSAQHLALWRIVIGLHCLHVLTSPSLPLLRAINASPHSLANSWFPASLYRFTDHNLEMIVGVGVIGSIGLMVGWLTRLMAVTVLSSFLLTQNYWFLSTAFHDDWLFFTFPLLVLCFAQSADAWSIDARRKPVDKPSGDPRAYRWPIEAGVFWFGFTYLAAGIAKVFPLDKGLIWLSGVSTQEFAIQFMHQSPLYSIFDGPLFALTTLWPFTMASILTVIVECGAVLVWWTDRYRLWVWAAVLGMHIGIYLMGIPGFIQIAFVLGICLIPCHWFSDCEAATPLTESASSGPQSELTEVIKASP